MIPSAPKSLNRRYSVVGIILCATFTVALVFEMITTNITESQEAAAAAEKYTPATSYTAASAPVKVAFLGDSFTQGTGADNRFDRWSTLVSNDRGWLELNYGFGGTNYATKGNLQGGQAYADRLTDLILSAPDVVVVSSAGNNLDLGQEEGIVKTFRELREGLPRAQIIATSPYYSAGERPAEFDDFGEDIKRAVESVDGQYVAVGLPLEDRFETISADNFHPNEIGYRALAAAIGPKLDAALRERPLD